MKWLLTSIILVLAVAYTVGQAQVSNPPPAGANPAPVLQPPGDFMSGVIGGPHDFSAASGMPDSACNSCHVPHLQAIRPVQGPIASATQPASLQPAIEQYRMPGQRRVFEPNRFTPGPTSLVCLGCHDGTIATSTIGSAHALLAGAREGFEMPDELIWRDHPIGVSYPANPREFRPLSFVLSRGGIRLPEGRVECVSCHDPHNAAGQPHLLVMSNRRSALCLACHVK